MGEEKPVLRVFVYPSVVVVSKIVRENDLDRVTREWVVRYDRIYVEYDRWDVSEIRVFSRDDMLRFSAKDHGKIEIWYRFEGDG